MIGWDKEIINQAKSRAKSPREGRTSDKANSQDKYSSQAQNQAISVNKEEMRFTMHISNMDMDYKIASIKGFLKSLIET